jgi:hypothetical protein
MAASMRVPLRRGPRPHPPTGGDNEAIKVKELEARRQVALVVSLAEATTSAPGSLTSGSDPLCADGLPATAATTARAPWQRGPRPCPPTGVRTKPSKNVAATSTVYDNTPGGVGAAWLAAQGTLRMRRTCTWRDRRPCSGRAATPHLPAGGSVGGGTKAIQAKEPDTRKLTAPAARPAPHSRSSPPPQGW